MRVINIELFVDDDQDPQYSGDVDDNKAATKFYSHVIEGDGRVIYTIDSLFDYKGHAHLSNTRYWTNGELFDMLSKIVPPDGTGYSLDFALDKIPDSHKYRFSVGRGTTKEWSFYMYHWLPNGVYSSKSARQLFFQSNHDRREYYSYINLTAVINKYNQPYRAIICPSMIFRTNLETGVLEDTGHRLWRIWYTRCNSPKVWGLIWVSQMKSFQLSKAIQTHLKDKFTVNWVPYDTDPIFE